MKELNWERASYRLKEGVEEVLREKTKKGKRELLKESLVAEGKYKKFVSLLSMLKSLSPTKMGPADSTLKRLFYHSENLPFNPEKFRFEETNLGNGGQMRVYLLESKTNAPSMAIKVPRPENETLDAVKLITRLKQERESIEKLYSAIPDLVPQEHYIVMEDPFKKGRQAATIVEEFIGGEMFDIFSFSPEELHTLTKNDSSFKNQLIKFIQITLRNESTNGEVVDILGPKNIIAVKTQNNSYGLILLDPHGYIKTKGNTDPRQIRAQEKLDFLKQVLSLIEK
ncbi:MAG: hypothetical protein WD963_00685 [Candidatus Paceibacterota bacterium]